jgi:hypothetical protein
LANTDVRPGTGERSTVSQAELTKLAYQVHGVSGGPRQPSGLSDDLAANVNAASVPQVAPGQAHKTTGNGARDSTQGGQTRSTGIDPHTR